MITWFPLQDSERKVRRWGYTSILKDNKLNEAFMLANCLAHIKHLYEPYIAWHALKLPCCPLHSAVEEIRLRHNYGIYSTMKSIVHAQDICYWDYHVLIFRLCWTFTVMDIDTKLSQFEAPCPTVCFLIRLLSEFSVMSLILDTFYLVF